MKKSIFYEFDEQGRFSKLTEEQWLSSQKLTWVRADLKSIKSLLKKMKATPSLVYEVLTARETRPRAFAYNGALLATFRGVNSNKDSTPEDMISVRLWMTETSIITVQSCPLETMSDIEKSLINGIGPKTAEDFLESLLCTMTDKSAIVVSALGDSLDAIEDRAGEKPNSTQRLELSAMRRRAILLRRYLIPQREAISRIAIDKLSWITGTGIMHFHEITDANTRLLEDLDAERERATVIHEELFSLAQEDMNKKMYWLTIVAIIFMPLSFLTGLLGINVGGIPGASFHHGFLIVSSILCVIFIVQLIYLKMKRWI